MGIAESSRVLKITFSLLVQGGGGATIGDGGGAMEEEEGQSPGVRDGAERSSASLEAIKRKLTTAGLTDEVCQCSGHCVTHKL